MKNIDYKYLCTVIGNLSGIPLRLYENDNLIFYNSLIYLPKDPLVICRDEVFAIRDNVGYYITPYFNYYGVVNSAPYKIVIGPTRQVPISEKDVREIAFKCDVPLDEVNEFITGMNSIVRMPLESVMQIMCTMNYVMNDEKLSLGDIRIYEAKQQNLISLMENERAENIFDLEKNTIPDQQLAVHNTLALEQRIMNIVRRGDVAALKECFRSAPAVRGGTLAQEQIRQQKNTFIVTATLVARAAIRGGMSVEDSLSLSDAYIQKCELFTNVDDIYNLQYRMVLDYTERVDKLRAGKSKSKLVIDVANYVQHHLSEAINTEDIAKALFMSRSRLSSNFKAETGENLVDFILREKTEEAKRFLRYTDKTAAAISAYLGFSSQSHFSRVFKKYTGKTPNEYREIHNR